MDPNVFIEFSGFILVRMVIFVIMMLIIYLMNEQILKLFGEAFIKPGLLLNRMYPVVVNKRFIRNPNKPKELVKYNLYWISLLLEDSLKNKPLSALVYLIFPYLLYIGSFISIMETYSFKIKILLLLDLIILLVILLLIYRNLILPVIIMSKWLGPDQSSNEAGSIVFSQYESRGHYQRIINRVVIMLDIYAKDKMGGLRDILLIQLFVHLNIFLFRSIPLLLWPLFLNWLSILFIPDIYMLIANLLALWVTMLWSSIVLFKTYNDRFGLVIKIRRNIEIFKLEDIKNSLLVHANKVFKQFKETDRIHDISLASNYSAYLAKEYSRNYEKDKRD